MKKRPTSGTWPNSSWRPLLVGARRLLDAQKIDAWALGGGSAMAMRFDHRISYDVDIFLTDAQLLGYLSPRLNDMALALAKSYDESANGIKIVTARGDIDFVVSRDLTGDAIVHETIDGIATPTHSNAEILAKKIEFRGFAFTHRDMFDLAVLIDREPASVEQALVACSATSIANAAAMIRRQIARLPSDLPAYVNPTASGAAYIALAPKLLKSFLARHAPHASNSKPQAL
jgi:hypothetical protein